MGRFDDKLIHKEVDRLFDELIHDSWQRQKAAWVPTIDVYEEQGAYVVEMELPGVGENDFQVTIKGRRLTISGMRESARTTRRSMQYLFSERCFGSFTRSLLLPEHIDTFSIERHFQNGLLRIIFSKRRKAHL